MKPVAVVTLGECMAVCYPADPIRLDDTRTLLLDIGGAEANLSIALARLGQHARFISRVGDDPFGQKICATLANEGVDISGVRIDTAAQTGVFFREWLPDGARRVYYYRAGSAASRMQPADLSPDQFAGAAYLHLTGITPALSASCAATLMHAIDLARAAGLQISFDPNFRPRLWSAAQAGPVLQSIARRADILLMGHEDAQAMLGLQEEQAQLEAAVALGPRIVVLKRAERSALALADGQHYQAPVIQADKVIDPVGAGDGFDAGFLAGLLRGGGIEAALQLGAMVGAASVAALGDYAGYPHA